MVFISYKLFEDKYRLSEEEIGNSYSLNDACSITYNHIINNLSKESFQLPNYKYYIHEYTEPVKPIQHPKSIYVFDAKYNCLNDKKQIIWTPLKI